MISDTTAMNDVFVSIINDMHEQKGIDFIIHDGSCVDIIYDGSPEQIIKSIMDLDVECFGGYRSLNPDKYIDFVNIKLTYDEAMQYEWVRHHSKAIEGMEYFHWYARIYYKGPHVGGYWVGACEPRVAAVWHSTSENVNTEALNKLYGLLKARNSNVIA